MRRGIQRDEAPRVRVDAEGTTGARAPRPRGAPDPRIRVEPAGDEVPDDVVEDAPRERERRR